MIETLRENLAWRRARKLLARRGARQWRANPADRRVLILLPSEERLARPAWEFIESLNLNPAHTLPIAPHVEVAFAPARLVRRVKPMGPDHVGRLGLPKKAFLREVWSFEPDVALCLASPFELGGAVLIGASPAAFRVGFFDERAEEFFDLMVGVSSYYEAGLNKLSDVLWRMAPPILARPAQAARSATAAW